MSELFERTFIMVKHDGIQRGLIGEVIKRFEQRGMLLAGIKMVLPDEETVGQHYPDDPEWKKSVGARNRKVLAEKGLTMDETDEEFGAKIREYNMHSLRGTPLVAMVWEGLHAADIGRKIVGATEPRKAEPGTIRGDYTTESFALADKEQRVVRNIVHASGSKEEAEKEINIWFKPEELHNYTKHEWRIMHSFD